jgi:hypothetical protein
MDYLVEGGILQKLDYLLGFGESKLLLITKRLEDNKTDVLRSNLIKN